MDFLAAEFLQDFLDESNGHLQTISTHLLALEAAPQDGLSEEAVNALFRAMHTLKGLCGMVGLQEAAELAHAMEGLLRSVRQGERTITLDMADALLEGTTVLQALIESVRTPEASVPDTSAVMQRLQTIGGESEADALSLAESAVLPQTPPRPSPPADDALWLPAEVRALIPEEHIARAQQALQAGKVLQLAVFTPSDERAARGVNVTAVRTQLEQAAQVISGVPLIEGQKVRFAFLLASETPLPEEQFPDVVWLPLEEPAAQRGKVSASPMEVAAPRRPERQGLVPSMRVEIARLDEILRLVGDLVVTRSRLHEALQHLGSERLDELEGVLEWQMRQLREAVMRVRLVPLDEVFARMPLAVRDIARQNGKQVMLHLEGGETEIDKSMVENLLDPLLHLMRNAVTHGIELPEERRAAGKPPEGRVTVRARPSGEHILIEVSDDGRGVDLEAVASKARLQGLLTEEHPIGPEEALKILCHPGFSTRSNADMGAGRGVGMDVVAQMVAQMGGALSMQTELGQGTTFTLRLPLSLTIFDAIIVQTGAERYAIPRNSVERIIEIEAHKLSPLDGQTWYPYEGRPVPLANLGTLFAVPQAGAGRYGLVLALHNSQPLILQVDALVGMQEIVMRAMHDPLTLSPGVAGATELGDGHLVLVLDALGLATLYNGGL